MLAVRVIPCLLLKERGLVKTVKFKDPRYLGDPRNTVRIFNEKEVDELVIFDILATVARRPIQFDLIQEIVSEAFMPVAYGGGVGSLEDADRLFKIGVEKIVINSSAVAKPSFLQQAANRFGSQSVAVCIDARRRLFGSYEVCTHGGQKSAGVDPVAHARRAAELGAGEIIISSIDRDGTMTGYDLDLVAAVSQAVSVPVIAMGGAGTLKHFQDAVLRGGAAAVAAGSLFVFQGKHRAVLINYPGYSQLKALFSDPVVERGG